MKKVEKGVFKEQTDRIWRAAVVVGGPHSLQVDLVEPLGQETLLHGQIVADAVLPAGEAVLAVAPNTEVTRGARFAFGLKDDALHHFDERGLRVDRQA